MSVSFPLLVLILSSLNYTFFVQDIPIESSNIRQIQLWPHLDAISSPTQPFLISRGSSKFLLSTTNFSLYSYNNFRSMCSFSLSICSPVQYVAKALHKIKKKDKIHKFKKKMLLSDTISYHKRCGNQENNSCC